MASKNYYDVTEWHIGNPYEDIGEVINSIIADIKSRQTDKNLNEGGKPGAVIFIPSGDYHLRTQVFIDISHLRIMGSGHGFISSSIRFNIPREQWPDLHEFWPGGSRILVDLAANPGSDESSGAAFYINRAGEPRISSVEFANFCIDGVHFVEDGNPETDPENTYLNGKTGVYVGCSQDSFRFTGMCFVYLEHGIVVYNADALSIHDNFIMECNNGIGLKGLGQGSKITDNMIGAGYRGHSIYAENFGGLLVSTNNLYPRGISSVCFDNVVRSSITGNRFHSYYPGMIIFSKNCSENLISSNHFLRDHEPWPPMQAYDNGLDDLYGILSVSGDNNSIIANHVSITIEGEYIKPKGAKPVILRLVSGRGNFVSSNYGVATTRRADEHVEGTGACYADQVKGLTDIGNLQALSVTTVLVEKESVHNIILDSGTDEQVVIDKTANAFRAIPAIP